MHLNFARIFIVFSMSLLAGAAWAGSIKTSDGKELVGEIALEADALVVKTADGTAASVPLSQIEHAVINQPPPAAPVIVPPPEDKREVIPPGCGLRAEYFDFKNRELKLVRIDPSLNFNWSHHEQPDFFVPGAFAARWTGSFQPRYSENYTLKLFNEGGVKIWIDDKLVFAPTDRSGVVSKNMDLRADRRYRIRAEFNRDREWGRIWLYWSSASQKEEKIPASAYLLPEENPNRPPAIRVVSPAYDDTFVAPSSVAIDVEASDQDGKVDRVVFVSGKEVLGEVRQPPYRFEWMNPPQGLHVVIAKVFDDGNVCASSMPLRLVVTGDGGGTLPKPWGEMVVGKLNESSARASDGSFQLKSKNGDIWEETGNYHFILQPFDGDGEIIARMTAFDVQDPTMASTAGIAISAQPKPGTELAFAGRVVDRGGILIRKFEGAFENKNFPAKLPTWLRLTRKADVVRAYSSLDGKDWQLQANWKFELRQRAWAGMVLASRNSESLGSATFDNVKVTHGTPPMVHVPGVVLRDGSMLAGVIKAADEQQVTLTTASNEDLKFPTERVSRLLYRGFDEDDLHLIPKGSAGVLLPKGDLYEAEMEKVIGGRVYVNSILFGQQSFGANEHEISAVLLRDYSMPEAGYAIHATDGSAFYVDSLRVEEGALVINAVNETIRLKSDSVREIRKLK